MNTSTATPRTERPRPALPPPATARELARVALGDVRGLEVLVAADGSGELCAALEREGARVTPVSPGADGLARPDAWRSIDLPTWSFDAVLAEGLLARAIDLERLLYRLRAWVRPGAPFAFVEPLAPAVRDAAALPARDALGASEVELVRRHLPGLRVVRIPQLAARQVPAWADLLRSAVESAATWLPVRERDARFAVLSGRLPP